MKMRKSHSSLPARLSITAPRNDERHGSPEPLSRRKFRAGSQRGRFRGLSRRRESQRCRDFRCSRRRPRTDRFCAAAAANSVRLTAIGWRRYELLDAMRRADRRERSVGRLTLTTVIFPDGQILSGNDPHAICDRGCCSLRLPNANQEGKSQQLHLLAALPATARRSRHPGQTWVLAFAGTTKPRVFQKYAMPGMSSRRVARRRPARAAGIECLIRTTGSGVSRPAAVGARRRRGYRAAAAPLAAHRGRAGRRTDRAARTRCRSSDRT
jgi:hypothetical protein